MPPGPVGGPGASLRTAVSQRRLTGRSWPSCTMWVWRRPLVRWVVSIRARKRKNAPGWVGGGGGGRRGGVRRGGRGGGGGGGAGGEGGGPVRRCSTRRAVP